MTRFKIGDLVTASYAPSSRSRQILGGLVIKKGTKKGLVFVYWAWSNYDDHGAKFATWEVDEAVLQKA